MSDQSGELTDSEKDKIVNDLDTVFGGAIGWRSLSDGDLIQLHALFVLNQSEMVLIFINKLSDDDRKKVIESLNNDDSKRGDKGGGILFGLPTFDEFIQKRPMFRRAFFGKE